MTTPADDAAVVDVPAESRFVIRRGGAEAELVYRVEGDRLELLHTDVPEEWGGRGIGGHLVRAALERARAGQLTLVPWCPFARRWLRQHADDVAGVAVDWDTLPPEW
jgi:hypothetical protein